MDSKRLVRETLAGKETGGVAVAPLFYTAAAHLRGLSIEEMMNDPTLLANSLADALELFGYDAVIASFDLSLEAEACGCEVAWPSDGPPAVMGHPVADGVAIRELDEDIAGKARVPVALEVAGRLSSVLRETAVLACVTGPLTMFHHLSGSTVSERMESQPEAADELLEFCETVSNEMVRTYGDLGIDAVILAEEDISRESEEGLSRAMQIYGSLWDVLRYFNAASVFLPGSYDGEQLEAILGRVGSDCVLLENAGDIARARDMMSGSRITLGGGVPVGTLSGGPDGIRGAVRGSLESARETGFLLSTSWEVPYAAPLDSIRELMESAR